MIRQFGKVRGSRIGTVVWKEFLHIVREPRTLIIVLVIPVLQLVLFGYALTFDIKNIPMAVYDLDKSAKSRQLVDKFKSAGNFELESYIERRSEVTESLDNGRARMVLVIPRDFGNRLQAGRKVPVQVLIDGADPTLGRVALGYSAVILQLYSRNIALRALSHRGLSLRVVTPIDARQRVWYNPELRSANFIVPGLIALLLMMIPAVLTAVAIVEEKERGTIERIIVSPVKNLELMLGKITPYLLIAAFDALLISVVGTILFEVPLRGSILLLASMTALYMLCTVSIGLFFSTLADSMQVAMMMVWMATMLPSFMLSGFVFPIASMPRAIQLVTYVVPAKYFLVIVRTIFLKGVGFSLIWTQALALGLFALLLIAVTSRRFRKHLE
jgi:ABC-2 type transport system permease protein